MWDMAECAAGTGMKYPSFTVFRTHAITLGKLCGAIFVDEAFEKNMSLWVGDRKWKKLSDSEKRVWKENYWEHGLKKSFNGAVGEMGLTLPVQVLVKQHLTFKVFSKDKGRPRVRGHELRLQRYGTTLALTIEILVLKKKQERYC